MGHQIELLKWQSEQTWGEVLTAIEGVSEPHAWGMLPQATKEYLHTDGSVQGIVLHLASCKMMSGSCGFRASEVRWRDCAAELDAFEPSWEAAMAYLTKAHEYWLSCWADLQDGDLEGGVPNIHRTQTPAKRIITLMMYQDAYHAGQIAAVRFGATESGVPPPKSADDIREHCRDLPSW